MWKQSGNNNSYEIFSFQRGNQVETGFDRSQIPLEQDLLPLIFDPPSLCHNKKKGTVVCILGPPILQIRVERNYLKNLLQCSPFVLSDENESGLKHTVCENEIYLFWNFQNTL